MASKELEGIDKTDQGWGMTLEEVGLSRNQMTGPWGWGYTGAHLRDQVLNLQEYYKSADFTLVAWNQLW